MKFNPKDDKHMIEGYNETCTNCGHDKVLHKDYCIGCNIEIRAGACKSFKPSNHSQNEPITSILSDTPEDENLNVVFHGKHSDSSGTNASDARNAHLKAEQFVIDNASDDFDKATWNEIMDKIVNVDTTHSTGCAKCGWDKNIVIEICSKCDNARVMGSRKKESK